MAWKFYYLAGSERIAMRVIDGGSNQLYYLFTDHLGSTSEVRRADGSLHSQQYYRAFGEERYTSGALPTDRTYTGQRKLDADTGLLHYGARIYDPYLNRFLSPDTIVPEATQGVQAWDRYAYSSNNPINNTDPSGHWPFPIDPTQIIQDAVSFFQSIGYSVVGDPTTKSIYSNGTDIVAQKENEIGTVTETLLVEVKQTVKVTLGTLGRDKAGNLGGSVARSIRTADRLANTSKEQLINEFKAIMEGHQAGNLQNALYTTADKISAGARNAFNYVYVAAADGAVTTVKAAETFITSTLNMPFLVVPYFMVDPNKSPIKDQPILQ